MGFAGLKEGRVCKCAHTEAVSVPSNSAMTFCISEDEKLKQKHTQVQRWAHFLTVLGLQEGACGLQQVSPSPSLHTGNHPPQSAIPAQPLLPRQTGRGQLQNSANSWEREWGSGRGHGGPCLLTPLSCSGQSGLGKSTLVNTLFKSQVSRKSSSWSREEKIPKTVEIKAVGHGEGRWGPLGIGQRGLWQEGGRMGLRGE